VHRVLITKIAEPQDKFIKGDIFKLNPDAITAGWLAALPIPVQAATT
jgi:hypothetical protein